MDFVDSFVIKIVGFLFCGSGMVLGECWWDVGGMDDLTSERRCGLESGFEWIGVDWRHYGEMVCRCGNFILVV